ncbi:heme oxygenase 1 [Octopus bimaculoides]|uniref:Heme oxygenase n=1 Tax=Octopus bimaculoides TaxID=37653 RepID=A0A0L8G213_OCTBM|nr:heme oxygenase 1 [Octopus bimaculoides]XP_052833164.1 heme oxygenase 1 [Octopus bimaculoides]XP_052833165.1 heme oxygenase 1 [Octopus bimaculoides]XP_052833166.1 heme oxygenase 1 [Octopus bimaculoides]|eukprot:XP_014784795.1 PREDICTED: heme oxygenase 1-like [Octopus bimaculoides]
MAAVESLSIHDSLKTGVAKEHEEAENGIFTQSIMKGTVTPAIYRQFLAELYEIYKAIEETAELNKEHETFGVTHFPTELNRVGAIEKDLEYYYGANWKEEAKSQVPTTTKYVARIKEVGKTNPTLLIAHCYVRYLGDMSGGKQIKYKLMKHFNLGSSEDGVAFFVFDQIDNVAHFKDYYFGRMNSISINDDQLADLVAEAKKAFQFNIDLFKDMNDFVQRMKLPQENISSDPSKMETFYNNFKSLFSSS